MGIRSRLASTSSKNSSLPVCTTRTRAGSTRTALPVSKSRSTQTSSTIFVASVASGSRLFQRHRSASRTLKKRAMAVRPIGFIHEGMLESTRPSKHGPDS